MRTGEIVLAAVGAATGGDEALRLRHGELLRATVVDILPDGFLTLAVKGSVLKARSEIAPARGERLLLRVEGEEGTVRLRLTGEGRALREAARRLLARGPQRAVTQREVTALKGLLDAVEAAGGRHGAFGLFFPSVTELTPQVLALLVRWGGLFFESSLRALLRRRAPDGGDPAGAGGLDELLGRDLKGLLLKMLGEGAGARERRALAAFSEAIEQCQLRSVADGALHMYLPLRWPGLVRGEISLGGTAGRDARPLHSCLVRLDFEETGPVTALVVLAPARPPTLHVSITAAHRGLAEAMEEGAAGLGAAFAAAGLRLGGLAVTHLPDAAYEDMPAPTVRGLDVRI